MAGVTAQFQLEGLREFQKTCRKAGLDMAEFSQASQRAGSIVSSAALSHVPIVTGNLAASIRPAAQKARVMIYAGNTSNVPYPPVIHWGWPAHNIRSNPFLTKAGQQTEPIWVQAFTDELNKILARIHGA